MSHMLVYYTLYMGGVSAFFFLFSLSVFLFVFEAGPCVDQLTSNSLSQRDAELLIYWDYKGALLH